MPKTAVAAACKYHVYVIELDPAALSEKLIVEANPNPRKDLPALYVGQSWRTPEVRFVQHKSGIKSSRMVRRFGIKLRYDLVLVFGKGPLGTRAEAEAEEARLTAALRAAGYPVWSH